MTPPRLLRGMAFVHLSSLEIEQIFFYFYRYMREVIRVHPLEGF
jgi:hypothetical protein